MNYNNEGCAVCNLKPTENHEPLMGNKFRQLSIKHGLRVKLCNSHHRYAHSFASFNQELQRDMQRRFEEKNTREEWMKIFGRNYLD
jgi:hypothetical protein